MLKAKCARRRWRSRLSTPPPCQIPVTMDPAEEPPNLRTAISLAVAGLIGCAGCKRTEQAILFIIGSSGEIQCIHRTIVDGAGSTEADGPQSVDPNGLAGAVINHHAFVLTGERIKSMNPTVTEVADQQAMCELAEIARCSGGSPRRVKPRTMLQAQQKASLRAEHTHEA